MRLALLATLAVVTAHAQPAPDSSGIAERFAAFHALAHADDVAAALPTVACPVEGPDGPGGRPVAGTCDAARAGHRARVERQLALVRHVFPEAPAAYRSMYRTEQEGREADGTAERFHLLLFFDLPAAPFALASFIEVGDAPLFGEVQLDDMPEDLPAPPSLVVAFERLLATAASDAPLADFAAHLVSTDGPDAWQAPIDAEDPNRVRGIELLRAQLSARASQPHEVVGFETERESEGEWHVLAVRFAGGGEPVIYAFLPVGGAFLLGDID